MPTARSVLVLGLGGAVWGGFVGIVVGAVLGALYGGWVGNLALGLDGAILGGLILVVCGAVYGACVGFRDTRTRSTKHRATDRYVMPSLTPRSHVRSWAPNE